MSVWGNIGFCTCMCKFVCARECVHLFVSRCVVEVEKGVNWCVSVLSFHVCALCIMALKCVGLQEFVSCVSGAYYASGHAC